MVSKPRVSLHPICVVAHCPLPIAQVVVVTVVLFRLRNIHTSKSSSISCHQKVSNTIPQRQQPERDVRTDPQAVSSATPTQHSITNTSNIIINTPQTITDPGDAQQRHQTARTPADTIPKDQSLRSHHCSPRQQQYTAATSSPSSSWVQTP